MVQVNPLREAIDNETVKILIGHYKNRVPIKWNLNIKGNPHLMIAGLPGMGKTTMLTNICKQLIQNYIHPIVFSYHEDIDEQLIQYAPSTSIVKQTTLNFNPLTILDRDNQFAHLDIAGNIRDVFQAIFPDLGDIQGHKIYSAIKYSFTETPNPQFGRFYQLLKQIRKPDRSLLSLLIRLEEMADYGLFRTSKGSLWNAGRSPMTIIQLHKSNNDNIQKAIAAFTFYNLYKEMLKRGPKNWIQYAVIFDEAHKASKLKMLPTMAKECRKFGISLIVASQEAKDFDPSLYSAIANYCLLRLGDTDAKAIVKNIETFNMARTISKVKSLPKFHAWWHQDNASDEIRLLEPQ